jgi:hypothetical protein
MLRIRTLVQVLGTVVALACVLVLPANAQAPNACEGVTL